jgi:hypothetical protein
MNEDVIDRRGSEGVWLTHPLRHEELPTGLRRDPVVRGALVLLSRRHDHPLAVQRMIRIFDDYFTGMMMGSMRYRRSAARNRC